jgi:hypothetical protein
MPPLRECLPAPAILMAGAAILLLPECGSRPAPPNRPWRVVPHGALQEAAKQAEGHACAIKDENLTGRGDPESCGPFPCDFGVCVVRTCAAPKDCSSGICSNGYCILPASHGSRACAPRKIPSSGPDSAEGDFSSWAGCQCAPQSAWTPRDREMCDSFPCSLEGCYVKRCSSDGDCEYGACSSHASHPHGYCVTDDPY